MPIIYRPRKCFGQHFLHDTEVINAIVKVINPNCHQKIVEIGPGLGALTIPIVKYIKNITVIEIDNILSKKLFVNPLLKNKLCIIKKDVRNVDFSCLSYKKGGKLRIFGNLPYNVSISILFYLFKYLNFIDDMYFMLQKEVALRLMSSPNNKNYGRLSIIAQYYCKIDSILEVLPSSFYPVPKVHSVMIRLLPYGSLPFKVNNIENLHTLINITFNNRRKMLRNSLNKIFNIKKLSEYNICETFRAENLSIEQYCRLANALE